ncbi:unnamed protein product [Ambrosiozyma monospora]|uniref:Unnamed protein product n=1 Tax=Ambrosiozyma monospora TaxID=43982 RepID=A0ACB5T4U1_AMBMO|nr:unnamed protein product [Ambrosiozyma monospora]
MFNPDIARTTAIEITSQLPREIKDLILQSVVLRYYNIYTFEDTRRGLTDITKSDYRDVLVPLISLINLSDPLLNYAVCLALPKLSFERSKLTRSLFFQQFADFALSKSTTRIHELSTDTYESFPLIEKLMEYTFEQIFTEFSFNPEGRLPSLQLPVLEQCSTLKINTQTLEHVCLSGLLTRSRRLKVLKISVVMATSGAYLLNEFSKGLRNWFSVNLGNKTDKCLILDLEVDTFFPNTEASCLNNITEMSTFLTNTKNSNVRFDIFLRLDNESENIFNGINTFLTQWHKQFNGTFSLHGSIRKEFYNNPVFTRFIDTVSNAKVKTLKLNNIHDNNIIFHCPIDIWFRYSASSVADLLLSGVSISKFQNLASLKRLTLLDCKLIAHDALSGIHELCDELLISGCKYYDSNVFITLPTSLQLLEISGDVSSLANLPEISNMRNFQRLRSVKASFRTYDRIEMNEERRIRAISWMERFVFQLPSTVETLFLRIHKHRRENISGNAIFHPEKLRFDNLTQLHSLSLLIDSDPLSTIPFDFSKLPISLEELDLVMPSSFSGKLPVSLQSLDINTRACEKFKV